MPGKRIHGILPALSTVCARNGEVDETGERRVVSFNIEKGVHGLVALVMNGEFYKFSEAERRRITDIVVDEANGRVPVFIGTTHTGTSQTVELSKYAENAGADGVVIMPPFFNARESTIGLHDHLAAVAEKIEIPIMVQEAEEMTGISISSSLITRLSEEYENVRYLKTEGYNAISKMAEVNKLTSGRVGIFGGYWGYTLVEELQAGALGTIPSCAIPEICLESYTEFRKGDAKMARKKLERYWPYLEYNLLNLLSFPQVDIEVLKVRGIIASTYMRGPKVPLSQPALQKLRRILKEMKVGQT